MSRRRIVPALVAAALAATLLAGCKSNVGVAARVSGDTISESDVNAYLSPKGVSSAVAAQAGDQPVSARAQILTYLIQEKAFEKTLAHLNVHPTEGQLAGQHDAAASLLLSRIQQAGGQLDRTLERLLEATGIKPSFRATFLRVQELEYLLIRRGNLGQMSQLVALVRKAKVSVSVSPRYGSWDAANLQLNPTSPLPSFVSAQPAPGGA